MIEQTRETSKRTLSLRIDGYEPIENISIDILGSTLVYELIPKFEDDIPGDIAVERLYTMAVSTTDKAKKIYLLRKIIEKDQNYDGASSYLESCLKNYRPQFIAVELNMDNKVGTLVTVNSGFEILNGTANTTELKLMNMPGLDSDFNPTGKGFFSVPPLQSIKIPVSLVNEGKFVIRQVGEEYWSDPLDISVHDITESEKYKSNAEKSEGEEHMWKTDMTVDGQPVQILEIGSATKWSQWKISFQ